MGDEKLVKMCTLEKEILRSLKEGKTDVFLRNIEKYITSFTLSGRSESRQFLQFTENLLHVFSTYLNGKGIDCISQIEKIVSRIEKCCQLQQENGCIFISPGQVNCSLCRIIVNLIELGFYQEAVLFSPYLLRNIKKESMNKETETMLNTLSKAFRGSMSELEKNKEFCHEKPALFLHMRGIELKLLILKQCQLQIVCDHSSEILAWYINKTKDQLCQNEIDVFCSGMLHFFIEAHKSVEIRDDVIFTTSIFLMLKDWIRVLVDNTTICSIPWELASNIESILHIVKASKNKTFVNIGGAIIGVVKHCIILLNTSEGSSPGNWNANHIEKCQNILLSFSADAASAFLSFIDSVVSLCCYLLKLLIRREKDLSSIDIIHLVSLVEGIVRFFIQKEEFLWNQIDGQCIFTLLCKILYGTVTILRKKIQDTSNITILRKKIQDTSNSTVSIVDLMTKTKNMLDLLLEAVKMDRKYSVGMYYRSFGNEILNIGIVYSGKEMYKEAIEYFEVGIQFLGKVLSMEELPASEKDIVKKNIWKSHELLSYSCFITEQYELSLKAIISGLASNRFNTSDVIASWIKVKKEMYRKGMTYIKKRTIKEEIEKHGIEVDKKCLVELLLAEMKAYRSERYDTVDECFSVATTLHEMSEEPLVCSQACIELARIMWLHGDKFPEVGKGLPFQWCKEALEMLNQAELIESNLMAKFLHSLANFWMCQIQMKNLQIATQREIKKLSSVPPETASAPRGDEEDEPETCDINPAFSYLNIHIQLEAVMPLNQALSMWEELFDSTTLTSVLSTQDLLELLDVVRTSAEIYILLEKDTEGLQAWNILRKAAVALNNPVTELWALSMLIIILCKHCLLDFAEVFMKEGEIVMEKVAPLGETDHYANLSKLKFQLAFSKFLFHSGELVRGLNMISAVVTSLSLERQTKSTMLLIAEAKMTLCHFILLSPSVLFGASEVEKHALELMEVSTPISLMSDSLKLCIGLQRHLSSGENTKQELPWYKLHLTRVLLDCALFLGELYINAGAPKEARYFLCESLTTAEELTLANRCASILTLLARLDLLCDNSEDCAVKLNGLTYILHFSDNDIEYLSAMQGRDEHFKGCSETEKSGQKWLQSLKSGSRTKWDVRLQLIHMTSHQTSPEIKKQRRIVVPSFLNHSDTCTCHHCQYFSLYNCFLDTLHMQSSLFSSTAMEKKNLLQDIVKYQQSLLTRKQNILQCAVILLLGKKEVSIPEFKLLTRSDLCLICNVYSQLSLLASNDCKFQDALQYLLSAYHILTTSSKLHETVYGDLISSLIYNKAMIYLTCLASSDDQIALNYFDVIDTVINNQKEDMSDISHLTKEINILSLNYNIMAPEESPDLSSLNLPFQTPVLTKARTYSKMCGAPKRKKVPHVHLEEYVNSLANTSSEGILKTIENESKKELKTPIKTTKQTWSQKENKMLSLSQKHEKKSSMHNVFDETNRKTRSRKASTSKQLKSMGNKQIITNLFDMGEYKFDNDSGTARSIDFKYNIVSELPSSKKKVAATSRKVVFSREDIEFQRGIYSDEELLVSSGLFTESDEYLIPIIETDECSALHLNEKMSNVITEKATYNSIEVPRTGDFSFEKISRKSRKKKTQKDGSGSTSKNENKLKKENDIQIMNDDYGVTPSKAISSSKAINTKNVDSDSEEYRIENTDTLGLSLVELYTELKDALSRIKHYPPSPLYSKMCVVMSLFVALLKKHKNIAIEDDDRYLASYYIAESSAVTLKHLSLPSLMKKMKRYTCADKESTVQTNGKQTLHEVHILKQDCFDIQKKINTEDIQEIKKLIEAIPQEWTVVQVSALPVMFRSNPKEEQIPPTLLVTRFRAKATPVSAVMNKVTDNAFNDNFLKEFNSILNESSATMKKMDAKVWWTVRRALDIRMKNLIYSMENIWLGCWKGLFLGIPKENIVKQHSARKLIEIMEIAECFNLKCADKYLLEVLLDSSHLLSDEQLSTAISCLWKFNKLDSRCKVLSLAIRKAAFDGPIDCHPVILILDKKVQALPWESMSLFSNHSVTRVPSLSLLISQLALYNLQSDCIFRTGVNTQNTYYILNPSNDIPETQLKFEEVFKRQRGWSGVIGRPPTQKEFSCALTDHDLFIYCGHGTGRVYLATESIERLNCRAATILMGCSSGKLKTYGSQYEPNGVVLQYWLGGSPCIVANLWDVTDKDIDRFTDSLLKSWLPAFQEDSVVKHEIFVTDVIKSARLACKLPHLIGSAPVVYGLPVFIS